MTRVPHGEPRHPLAFGQIEVGVVARRSERADAIDTGRSQPLEQAREAASSTAPSRSGVSGKALRPVNMEST